MSPTREGLSSPGSPVNAGPSSTLAHTISSTTSSFPLITPSSRRPLAHHDSTNARLSPSRGMSPNTTGTAGSPSPWAMALSEPRSSSTNRE